MPLPEPDAREVTEIHVLLRDVSNKLVSVDAKVDRLGDRIDSASRELTSAINFGDRQNSQKIDFVSDSTAKALNNLTTALNDGLTAVRRELAEAVSAAKNVAETATKGVIEDVADHEARLKLIEDRSSQNFRLAITGLILPISLVILTYFLTHGLAGK